MRLFHWPRPGTAPADPPAAPADETRGADLDTRLRLIRASLPGLVHYDVEPLVVPVGRRIKRFRIYLPQRGALVLRRLTVLPITGRRDDIADKLAGAAFTLSSQTEGSSSPERLIHGHGIRTDVEAEPFYEVTFRRTALVGALHIKNDRGTGAARNMALRVDIEDSSGGVTTFDNASRVTVLDRLKPFNAALNDLCVAAWHDDAPDKVAVLAEIETALTALAATLRRGLAGGAWSRGQIDDSRLAAIALIVRFAATLPPVMQREGLGRAGALLHFLLYRGRDTAHPNGTEDETRAVGIVFAGLFLNGGKVSSRYLRENQRFFGTPERAGIIERFVSGAYLAATGDATILPIMIRSHSLSGSNLIVHAESFVASIAEVQQVFADIGYNLAICYGTLLGAVRDKGFIPYDDDLDTALLLNATTQAEAEAEMDAILVTLKARDVQISRTPTGFMKIRAPVARRRMDVFPVFVSGADSVVMHMQHLRPRDVPRDVVLPFGSIEFYGRQFACPAKPEAFLAERYGESWTVPLRYVGGHVMRADGSDQPVDEGQASNE